MAEAFPFVQFEFPSWIGPEPGRYVLRADDLDEDDPYVEGDVLVVRRFGAPAAPAGLLRKRPRQVADGEAPAEVMVVTCTIVKATQRLESGADARALLRKIRESREEQENWIEHGLILLNEAVTAHRVCTADPYAIDVRREAARAVRIGYGDNEQVFDGQWLEALLVPPPKGPRLSREGQLQPQQGIAAVLKGGAPVLEAEELLLRVMLDAEHERRQAAAVGLKGAIDLLVAEVDAESLARPVLEQLEAVQAQSARIDELALLACRRPLTDLEADEVQTLVGEAGAVVDGWRYGGVPA